jgi:hypothetical protein
MPTSYVEKMAKENHISLKTAESYWKRAEDIAKKEVGESAAGYFGYVTGIFKHMLGHKAEARLIDYLSK